ncbi:cytochrome c biogenesis protein CcdA [Acidiphilium sp.]|uniref:cytochrome c biogenesis protein CcdA n=1 Tax=Acidiphilium sp. TaxID=527 RepID=UPI000BDDD33C|nr:cytochrome c biogenesis protein CcdA [Acidiphilium sp.]OYV54643.1 MAG: hypothetical protein B7Z76_13780 [Acidiphilium sp. 20-67-58]OYV88001.1 MAG: hypothetical protein B7Z64_00090 [Acidiphilium sp. 21-68-69]HQT62083.1 cytochrome c biogenesis protein CcdA [Acidiphilium sp.]HQT73050.1 cytochrome c biogenesis protein CcdA [Acidiphilium sp.]
MFAETILLPIGLGLLGFIEPCTLGSTLIFLKFLEDKSAARKLGETLGFMLVRALVIGLLGALAALLGTLFLGVQKALWIALGILYVGIGVAYLTRRIAPLMIRLGPSLSQLAGMRGSLGLGVLFGLNIPACAAPLVLALLATAAAHGAVGGSIMAGFLSLVLFGVALSLPLIVAVLVAPARGAIDWFGELSRRIPIIVGLVLIVFGLWSIREGVFVSIRAPMPGMALPAMTGVKG